MHPTFVDNLHLRNNVKRLAEGHVRNAPNRHPDSCLTRLILDSGGDTHYWKGQNSCSQDLSLICDALGSEVSEAQRYTIVVEYFWPMFTKDVISLQSSRVQSGGGLLHQQIDSVGLKGQDSLAKRPENKDSIAWMYNTRLQGIRCKNGQRSAFACFFWSRPVPVGCCRLENSTAHPSLKLWTIWSSVSQAVIFARNWCE
jgi:hypothetical protein